MEEKTIVETTNHPDSSKTLQPHFIYKNKLDISILIHPIWEHVVLNLEYPSSRLFLILKIKNITHFILHGIFL